MQRLFSASWKFGVATLIVAGSIASWPATADAQVITFDNLPGPNYGPLTAYTENGYTVYNVSGPGSTPSIPASAPVYQVLDFFGPSIGSNTTGTVLISKAGPAAAQGGEFTFNSFDFGIYDGFTDTSYSYAGYLDGTEEFAGEGSYPFLYVNNTWDLIANPDSGDLITALYITLNGGGGGANLTQIALNGAMPADPPPIRFSLPVAPGATPEPAGVALLGTGVLGLVGAMRRGRSLR